MPRSGVELIERIAERWRWYAFRVRFHPWTIHELPRILNGLQEYARLMRLDRPIGIWLLLWPTLWALWISSRGKPNPRIFIIFVAGTVLMRSAGCAVNDYADRSFDPHVARTKDRPLAAGRISTLEALMLFALLSMTALMLALQLNKSTLLLAVAGGFLAVSYPFVKRFLAVPQMYLGVTFGWGIPMAFMAQYEQVPRVAWLLLLANVLWVTVYDTIYAMVDRDDDLKIGVRSTAILFGDSDRHIIAVLQIMTLVSLYLVGGIIHMGYWYDAGLWAGAAFFVYQLWLIRARDREACFRAFLNNNYFGMAVFIGMALEYQFARQ
jgi:4-hydroxybenzoate polyprenyltransferase